MTNEPDSPPGDGEAGTAGEFERLLAAEGTRRFAPIAAGDRVSGTVVSLTPTSILVDVGQRSEGVVPLEQIRPDDLERLKVGDRAEFLVTQVSGNGIELSCALAARVLEPSRLKEAYAAGIPVDAKVSGENKGGFSVELPGVRGFVPYSQMEVGPARPLAEYLGHTLRFRVLEVRGKDVILSRAALLREEQERARREVLATLSEGQELEASVVKVERFGAFIDVGGGLHALVPTSEMAWSGQSEVRDMLRPGFGVRVRIIQIQREGQRPKITASMKAITRDPWLDAAHRFQAGQVVTGKVTRIAPFGAFFEIAPGIEGLAHVSELSATRRVQSPTEVVRPGEQHEAVILSIDPAARRIALSLAQRSGAEIDAETRAKYVGESAPGGTASGGRMGSGLMAEALRRALENRKK